MHCIFKPGKSQFVQFISHLFVFEDFLKNSASLSFHLLAVFLLHGPSVGVDVAEDKVELRLAAALVRPEHDRVGGLVRQLPQVKVLGAGQKLDVPAAAVEPVLESDLKSTEGGFVTKTPIN